MTKLIGITLVLSIVFISCIVPYFTPLVLLALAYYFYNKGNL